MDINVGNDIRVNFIIKNVDTGDSNIECVKCYFINTSTNNKNCNRCCGYESFPQYYDPTMYTIGSCGEHVYNVLPHTCHSHKKFLHEDIITHTYRNNALFEGHTIITNKEKFYVSSYFSGHNQTVLGTYKIVVIVVMKHEEGWKKYKLHEYSFNYGEQFKLVKDGGKGGPIEIDLDGPITDEPPIDNPPQDDPTPQPPVNNDKLYIGFVTEDVVNNNAILDADLNTFSKYNRVSGTFSYQAGFLNAYLTLVSSKKITSIKNALGLQMNFVYVGEHPTSHLHYYYFNKALATNLSQITISA